MRGQLVKMSVEESQRLGVPKARPWLIVQNNDVRDSLDVVVCPLTTRVNKDGSKKKTLTTDVELDKGSELSQGRTLPEDSYIRCSQLYSAQVSKIEYYGTLPADCAQMLAVDKNLLHCLGLEWLSVQESNPVTKPTETAARNSSNWAGRKTEPVRKLHSPKKNKNKR